MTTPKDGLARPASAIPEDERQRDNTERLDIMLSVDGGELEDLGMAELEGVDLDEVLGLIDEESIDEPLLRNGVDAQNLLMLHIVHDLPWPNGAAKLAFLQSEQGREKLEELVRRAGADFDQACILLAVRSELIRLDLEPERYAEVDVREIHRSLARLKDMKNKSERSCFLLNLRATENEDG